MLIMNRTLAWLSAALMAAALIFSLASAPAQASTAQRVTTVALMMPAVRLQSVGDRALNWAEANALNHPYQWGGAGPWGYDCSGLVMTAFWQADRIALPHNTVAMVESGRLHRVWGTPRRGDLAFWGSPSFPYHVEFVTMHRGISFGAENYGWAGRVTWHSDTWFEPSSFWRVW